MRRKYAHTLKRSGFEEEDVDPNASVSNMSDCMLLIAVAVMIALITHWNIDITGATQVDTDAMQHVDDPIVDAKGESSDGSTEYEQAGTVYKDTKTGELYIVK